MLYRLAKISRFFLFLIIALVVVLPTAFYLLISSDWAQRKICEIGQRELSAYLGTDVEIGSVRLQPFNTLTINDVAIADDNDSIALRIHGIDSRFEIWDFIFNQKIIIDYATLSGLDLKLYRHDKDAPLNIQNILKRIIKPKTDEEPKHFKLRLNDVTLENCSFSYDVLSVPLTPSRFNASHIALHDVDVVAFVPVLTNDDYHVWLRNLSFTESSGLKLAGLSAEVEVTPKQLRLHDFVAEMPNSRLLLSNFDIPIENYDSIKNLGITDPLHIQVLEGSHIYLPDLAPFGNVFSELDFDIDIMADVEGTLDDIKVRQLRLADKSDFIEFDLKGNITGITNVHNAHFGELDLTARTHPKITNVLLSHNPTNFTPVVKNIVTNIGAATLKVKADGTIHDANVDLALKSDIATAKVVGKMHNPRSTRIFDVEMDAEVDSVQLGLISGNPDLNKLSAAASVKGVLDGTKFKGDASADIKRFDFKGHRYDDITAVANVLDNNIRLEASVNDRYANIGLDLICGQQDRIYYGDVDMKIKSLSVDSLNLAKVLQGYKVDGDLHFTGTGLSLDNFNATMSADGLKLIKSDGESLTFKSIHIDADNTDRVGHIWLNSDYINGSIDGQYRIETLGKAIQMLYCKILPPLRPDGFNYEVSDTDDPHSYNRIAFDFDFKNPEAICEFFNLPITVIEEADLFGSFDELHQKAVLSLDVPWIEQGDKIIESTMISVNADGEEGRGVVYATSLIPTKKGDMEMVATINGQQGILTTNVDWRIIRSIPINGNINFKTTLYKNDEQRLSAQVDFDNSQINFGNEVWNLRKSTVIYTADMLRVNNFGLSTPTQGITINGIAGKNESDVLIVRLDGIQLINIFETLEIDKALISGFATGTVYASALFSEKPDISCQGLKVRDIGYNYCTLGDAMVNLKLENEGSLFVFDADVVEPGGRKSYLDGSINIPTEELDLNINADHVKVGFMKPFMEAFTSDVSGFASGNAHLYGTFKNIDLTGDIQADSLRIKIDFTNTWYSASDSIHIRPGRINLKNIVIYDDYGNTALLNGWVGHKYFHEATFDFKITNARNFLSYDETEKNSPDWYGRIFGTGSATINGKPGVVNIGVNMTTAPNSVFTFVLSDLEEASEYSFITFRDATPRVKPDTIIDRETIPLIVREIKSRHENQLEDEPTAYNMDIRMDITPQAQIIIVMDPIGGDRIRAYGSGNMRMTYGSTDNDLRLYGKYTLDRGNYNFTLQDIIIKDFTIKKGSSINFTGDPYSANLDIDAYYQVNANLSDLDESFLQDKELNRTNVPVRALLLVTGDMRQPDIAFDLEFPSLNHDTYRKVKSIVSTEDMMNKQIIYLLALNRFYTPEYMASTTKGNEIFSVASSTIASQLSSMLGKLSENWSIAPNLRSDRGDFSDFELDLQLSSSLLNNRLLFNGNFGYREKSLNANQFIGDFDIEYLINRQGTLRTKFFNRYNDQNYYLRTALTTQGAGIVLRHDFDNILGFLRHDKKPKTVTDTVPQKIMLQPVDSLIIDETITIKDLPNDSIK